MDPIKQLVSHFSKLPGIGERTALRLVLHLLDKERSSIFALASSLNEVGQKVRECLKCCNLTADEELCTICSSNSRDESKLCVIATVQDLMAIEATGEFYGFYHVLHGTLAPLEGKGPSQLRMGSLFERLKSEDNNVKEMIIATPPSVEGEATALYLCEEVRDLPVLVTRIASGVPVGGELQFTDRLTLSRAMSLRRGISNSQ